MHYILPIPPRLNKLYRTKINTNSLYTSEESKQYKEEVWYRYHQHTPSLEPMVMTVRLYHPNSKSDIDGRLKVLLDSLQGCAYKNDSQIKELHVYKLKDRENPRCEVWVEPILIQAL